jgi:aminobenzoyl-glutamate utilization protein B
MNRILALFTLVYFMILGSFAGPSTAADPGEGVERHVEARRAEYGVLAQEIWDLSELGYREFESSTLLRERLRKAGFRIETGVADIPTAFVAV